MSNIPADSTCSNIAPYIAKVTGLPSNSASATEIWVLTPKSGVMYNGRLAADMIAKIGISYYSLTQSPEAYSACKLYTNPQLLQLEQEASLAQSYEIRVYRDVISPLANYGVCSNFVTYVSSAEACGLDQIKKILFASVHDDAAKKQLYDNLIRNVMYMLNSMPRRPAIDHAGGHQFDTDKDAGCVENLRFDMLLTEYVNERTKTLHDVTVSKDSQADNQYFPDKHPYEFTAILFQVAAACCAMSFSHTVQNDLHTGNVLVTKSATGEPVVMRYVIDGRAYNIRTAYFVRVYDFDHAYAESLGPNRGNTEYLAQYHMVRNKFVPNLDIIKAFGVIWHTVSPAWKAHILDIVAPSDDTKRVLKSVYDRGIYLAGMTDELFAQMRTTEEIVDVLGRELNKLDDGLSVPLGTYIMDRSMFDATGKIKPREEVLRMQQQIRQKIQQ